MAEAYIVDAVRTPVGRRRGSLASMHPADLGGTVLSALMTRTGVDPGAIDDVMMGCCDTIGGQAGDVARTAWLVAGLPEHVPGVTIDRQCGSSQQAVHFAAQAVLSGTADLVVAGGLQNMSAIPISAAMLVGQDYGFSTPFAQSPGWLSRYGDQEVSQFRSAEMIAEKWGISREDMESFALTSHQRARTAIDEGRFADEIVPVGDFTTDETVRDTSLAAMAALQPLSPGGRITAAVASQISDAASALLVASESAVDTHGLRPRARIRHLSVRADDPVWMLTGPISATQHALAKAGLGVDDIDLWECNEAFASVVLAWAKECRIPLDKVNVNGGG
ncbi:MAG TPA: acetyl-CoA C-acyltransferase, partial [Marmoricola sp.]|nr:acetyl-CoA C-acyltransferase [Marmoricola sp.]